LLNPSLDILARLDQDCLGFVLPTWKPCHNLWPLQSSSRR
jgi:hypothetical protein